MKGKRIPSPDELFGKGKMLEPPFRAEDPRTEFPGFNPFCDMYMSVKDRTGKLVMEIKVYDDYDLGVAHAIVQLLNEKYS